MFEAYVEMGVENVGAPEVAKGFASFAVVAIGGTIIGISKRYTGMGCNEGPISC